MKFPILFVVLSATLTACHSKESAPPVKTERPALTMIAGALNADRSRFYSGEIRARHELNLGFRVSGKIVERLVDAGAQVKAGQVLARLDPSDAGLQAGAAQAQLNLIDADAKRYRDLRAKGFVSQSALDAKEAALAAATAQAGLTHNQSAYVLLKAEHDGVVAATMAEAGQVVGIGQPVLHLALSGEQEVAIEIPETEFSRRHVGDVAEVTTGNDGEIFTGRLRELSPVADSGSRTYAARVSFSAPYGKIALGMTAQVRFDGGRKGTDQLLVPLTAIYQQGRHAAVWVVAADHSVGLRRVEVAEYRDNGAVIASGLAAGERIVSAGVHRLSPGEKIRFIEALGGSAQ